MLMTEFVDRTGYTPTQKEYAEIERQYAAFDGDKNSFCEYWRNHYLARFIVCEALQKTLNRTYRRQGGNTPFTNAVADYVNFIQNMLA